MIIREWRGRARADRDTAYPAHFCHGVLPTLKTIDGFQGAELLQRMHGDAVEFVVLTRWTSLEAVAAFAGVNMDDAVVEPEAIAALIDYDTKVQHYTVIEGS